MLETLEMVQVVGAQHSKHDGQDEIMQGAIETLSMMHTPR